jgi:hypothetical protein
LSWALDVVAHGVGTVGRNTVLLTTTQIQANGFLEQKIITPPIVVAKRKDSKKKTIVLEGIQGIVENDGLKPFPLTESRNAGSG